MISARQGFITLKRTKQVSQDQEPQMMYDEFLPFLYCQYEQTEHLNFGSFGAAIDTFFAEIESQRIAVQKAAQQVSAQCGRLGETDGAGRGAGKSK